MRKKILKVLDTIAQAIYDKKGKNIIAIDVLGVSTLTDYYLIAEGSVERHVMAMSKSIMEKLNDIGEEVLHVEGENTGDWIVIDTGEIMVHLLTPQMREKYSLEQVWSKGKVVDLNIDITNSMMEKING